MNPQSINRDELLIEPADLLKKMGQQKLRIFDATVVTNQTEGEPSAIEAYRSAHIPGAAFLDHQLLADKNSPYQLMIPPAEALASTLGEMGIGNDTEVVVYATTMLAWATRIWWLLRYAGFKNIRVLNGGLVGWQEAGGEIESGSHTYPPATLQVNVAPGWFVSKEEVVSALEDDETTTVNTLPMAAYEQAHISGSTCVPCLNFLDKGTRLLSNEELVQRLGEVVLDKSMITYCGGGVAATVNAVVHKLVGNPDVRVYDGSMSEWTGEGLPLTKAQS